MITCTLLGGLGNQLFQIFTVISYAIDCKNTPGFINTKYTLGMTHRITYWDTFLIHLQKWIYPNLNPYFPILREKTFYYQELPVIKDSFDVRLAGYFQSYKYFEKNKYKILEYIHLKYYKKELSKRININFHKTISLHFRIGDYKLLQDKYPLLTEIYYRNALEYILQTTKINQNELNVLYFYEKNDLLDVNKIISKLKEDFKELTFIPINQSFQDWEQLIIMSCCIYNIIANSTFSWWGAFFNDNFGSIVCFPNVWFGPKLQHDTKDLFPPEWIKINV